MAEGVERYWAGPQRHTDPNGSYVRYPAYEKLKAERDEIQQERNKLAGHLLRAERQCDQARQEVLEEVAAEFEREAEKYARKYVGCRAAEKRDRASGKLPKRHTYEATWNYYEGLSRANERAASHCRSLATLDPSGEDERSQFQCHGPGCKRDFEVEGHATLPIDWATGSGAAIYCPGCQPVSDPSGEQGDEDWPAVTIARDSDGALEVATADGDDDNPLPAYERAGIALRRYVPATDPSKEVRGDGC